MTSAPDVMHAGAARVTILNAGNSLWSLAEMLAASGSDEHAPAAEVPRGPSLFPTQCVHIAVAGASMLVDACCYDFPLDSPQRPPGYEPPPDVSAQLESIGVHPETITHLVIAHLHADHYGAATLERDGAWIPRFPNARCYIGRRGWQEPDFQRELRDPDSQVVRTLGVLERFQLVELVDGDHELRPGVRLIAAPGEAPGHQLVRLHSQGETLYCLGDLYHHPLEVAHPALMCEWCDVAANLASRQAITTRALAENAVLVAAHIAGAGRLEQTESGVRWIHV